MTRIAWIIVGVFIGVSAVVGFVWHELAKPWRVPEISVKFHLPHCHRVKGEDGIKTDLVQCKMKGLDKGERQ